MLVMADFSGFFGWDENPLVKRWCHFADSQPGERLAILASTYLPNTVTTEMFYRVTGVSPGAVHP
jgi:hypothetical protein